MGKKVAIIAGALLVFGAGITFFGYNKAQARVCFVDDPDCNGISTVYGTGNSSGCAALGYGCSQGGVTATLADCPPATYAPAGARALVSNTIIDYGLTPVDQDASDYWTLYSCPYDNKLHMPCPKGFRQVCPAGLYKTTEVCGHSQSCICKDDYKYRLSIFDGLHDNVGSNGEKRCHATGVACQDILPNGSLASDPKFSTCICSEPYRITISNCLGYNGEPVESDDYCLPSNAPSNTVENRYVKGCVCPSEYQYTQNSPQCTYVDGGPCITSSGVALYSNCHSCANDGYPADSLQYVGSNNSMNIAVSGVQGCSTSDTTCMQYFQHNSDGSYSIKADSPKVNTHPNLWAFQQDKSNLHQYAYITCPYDENSYYIAECSEPGMRPSKSTDVKEYDADGQPVAYYQNGETCVPVGCMEAVKAILRSGTSFGSPFIKKYGIMTMGPITGSNGQIMEKYRSDSTSSAKSGIFFIDGYGNGIVERLVNTKSGGRLQTSTEQSISGMTYEPLSDHAWTAGYATDDNGTVVGTEHGSTDPTFPARKIAIVLASQDYAQDYESTPVAAQHYTAAQADTINIINHAANNYDQRKWFCKRLACYTETGNNRKYYTATNSSWSNNPETGEGLSCQTAAIDVFDLIGKYLVKTAKAGPWDSITSYVCENKNYEDRAFWKFSEGNLLMGNDSILTKGCGSAYSEGTSSGCYPCIKKHTYRYCHQGWHEVNSDNNCMADLSTGPDSYTPMTLQTENDGFCVTVTTNALEGVHTPAGLQGIPADEYISVEEFYNRIQNGASIEETRKAMYLTMLERSCKRNGEFVRPKIQHNTTVSHEYFPANDDSNIPETDLTFRGIDLTLSGSTVNSSTLEISAKRRFNFYNGTLKTTGDMYLKINEIGTIENSTLDFSKGATLAKVLYDGNIIDTDINLCGTLVLDNGSVTSTNGSNVIAKKSNCGNASAVLEVDKPFTSDKYKYVLDGMSLNVGNALGDTSVGCIKATFIGQGATDIQISNTLSLIGLIDFQDVAINMAVNSSAYLGSSSVDACLSSVNEGKATFVNMYHSRLSMPENSTFEITARSAMGTTTEEILNAQGGDWKRLDNPSNSFVVFSYGGTNLLATGMFALSTVYTPNIDQYTAIVQNGDHGQCHVSHAQEPDDENQTIFQVHVEGGNLNVTCPNTGAQRPTAYRYRNGSWSYKQNASLGYYVNDTLYINNDLVSNINSPY